MSAIAAFVLGLLVGWVVEWIIDWVYWRRQTADLRHKFELAGSRLTQAEDDLKKSEGIRADLQNQLAELKTDDAARREKITALETDLGARQEKLTALEASGAELRARIAALEAEKASLPAPEVTREVTIPAAPEAAAEVPAAMPAAMPEAVPEAIPVKPDDLEIINGIGPVIARKLNAAGIRTFRDLAALTPQRLREIVGDVIQRLADEDDIIDQARKLAAASAAAAADEAPKA